MSDVVYLITTNVDGQPHQVIEGNWCETLAHRRALAMAEARRAGCVEAGGSDGGTWRVRERGEVEHGYVVEEHVSGFGPNHNPWRPRYWYSVTALEVHGSAIDRLAELVR